MFEKAYRGIQVGTFGLTGLATSGVLLTRPGNITGVGDIVAGLTVGLVVALIATLVVSAGMNFVRNILGV